MNKIIITLLILIFSSQLFAQQKGSSGIIDSSCSNQHIERKFQFGMRIMSGINYYNASAISGFNIENYLGSSLNLGVIARCNFNKKWAVNGELRFGQRSGKLHISNSILGADFNLSEQEIQIPIYGSYNFFNRRNVNLFSLGFGLIYGQSVTQNNSNLIYGNFYWGANENNIPKPRYCILFSISKDFYISKSSILFIGVEYNQQINLSNNQDIKFDYTDLSTNQTNHNSFKLFYTSTFLTTGIKF